ncbi:MAG: carboxyl-terminal processing protease, partial [Sphingomonadales bacterium]|nr:carboxyl-terminal processing protease [Sphingomonadales bacterium]
VPAVRRGIAEQAGVALRRAFAHVQAEGRVAGQPRRLLVPRGELRIGKGTVRPGRSGARPTPASPAAASSLSATSAGNAGSISCRFGYINGAVRQRAAIATRRAPLQSLITRSGRAPSALLGLVRLPLEMRAGEAGRQIYRGPVVLLVNQATASTSEVIAASLQEQGRARIVGTRSCGCALGVLRYRRLPDGGALAISEIGIVSGLGRRIEGAGVAPDETVALRIRDLAEGRDPALDRALSLLAR